MLHDSIYMILLIPILVLTGDGDHKGYSKLSEIGLINLDPG